MDSNSTWICRLCLKTSDDVNVFETFQNSTIAPVLTQHFWFKVDKNDGYAECLCEICWINVKTFHNFYNRVKWLHRNYPVKLVKAKTSSCSNVIKQERSDSPLLEPDLNIVKCEETQLQEQMIDLNQQESFSYNDDNSCNRSKNDQTSDNEDQTFNKKRKIDGSGGSNDTENKTLSPGIEGESSSEDERSHKSSNTQPPSQNEKDN